MVIDPNSYNSVMYALKIFKRKLRFNAEDTEIDFNKRIHIPTIYCKSNLLPNASAKIKISKNEGKKRFIAAVSDIETGIGFTK